MARRHISHWNQTISVMRDRGENVGEALHEIARTAESLAISMAHEPRMNQYHIQLTSEIEALLNVVKARIAGQSNKQHNGQNNY